MSSHKRFRVGVIGAGLQGIAQCKGIMAVKGVEVVGLADIRPDRLRQASDTLDLPAHSQFLDAEQMLTQVGPLDLVCVATTAPWHVKLGRLALRSGVKRILLEKPIDNSLCDARAFNEECRAAGAVLTVNYSRRWSLDYRAVSRCIARNFIGEPRSISITVGKGELAMHGSHYFDLCRYLLTDEPAWVVSHLDPINEVNVRGANFQDPSGVCMFVFRNGARAFVDFSSDLLAKDPFVTIKGTLGRITIDEPRMFWTLQSRSQRTWTFPFAEPLRASTLFSRVVVEALSSESTASGGVDGVAALEMIIAAHLSHQRSNRPVSFPLSDEESAIDIEFP